MTETNYVDSMTPEEREKQIEIQKNVVITTTSVDPIVTTNPNLEESLDTKTWEQEFDEKFTRFDLSEENRGYVDTWFVRETITSADIKKFIRSNFVADEQPLKLKKLIDQLSKIHNSSKPWSVREQLKTYIDLLISHEEKLNI